MANHLSEKEKEAICQMFDSYCKKVLKHAAMDYDKKTKRIAKHETSIFDVSPNTGALVNIDKYFSQNYFFNVSGESILVKGAMADSIACLPQRQRQIILLSYFTDISDSEIGKKLNISRRVVQYQRKKALEKLKNILTKENQI